jgi:hypothetical protein
MTSNELADALLDAIDEAKRIPKRRIQRGDLLGFRNDLQQWKTATKQLIRGEVGRDEAMAFEELADVEILGPSWDYLEEIVKKYETLLNELADRIRERDPVTVSPPSQVQPRRTVEAFCSYSSKDSSFRDELETHLAVLIRERSLNLWSSRLIEPGMEWDSEIRKHLARSQVVLLLVSPDFIASQYSWEEELRYAIKRHEEGRARVIPIIIRPCDWSSTQLKILQALPTQGKPVTSWSDRDAAWNDVTTGIRLVVEGLRSAPVQQSLSDGQKEILGVFAARKIRSGEGLPINVLIGRRNLGAELDGLLSMGMLQNGPNHYLLLTSSGEELAYRAE